MSDRLQVYVAHILMRVIYDEPIPEETIPLWENLHLIKAKDDHEAFEQAERIGRDSEISEGFFCEDRPSTLRFVGIRKMKLVPGYLRSGRELTDLQLEVASEEDLELLMANRSVAICCYDDYKSL